MHYLDSLLSHGRYSVCEPIGYAREDLADSGGMEVVDEMFQLQRERERERERERHKADEGSPTSTSSVRKKSVSSLTQLYLMCLTTLYHKQKFSYRPLREQLHFCPKAGIGSLAPNVLHFSSS